jgi:hypothetical protein
MPLLLLLLLCRSEGTSAYRPPAPSQASPAGPLLQILATALGQSRATLERLQVCCWIAWGRGHQGRDQGGRGVWTMCMAWMESIALCHHATCIGPVTGNSGATAGTGRGGGGRGGGKRGEYDIVGVQMGRVPLVLCHCTGPVTRDTGAPAGMHRGGTVC